MIDDDKNIFTISKDNDVSFEKSWSLDLVCVIHVCSQKYYFDSLNDKMTNKLSLDNDSTIKITSVNKIKIKIIDQVVYTLEDISYILKMSKNIISLSFLIHKIITTRLEVKF